MSVSVAGIGFREWEPLNWVHWFNQIRLLGPIGHTTHGVPAGLVESANLKIGQFHRNLWHITYLKT